MPIATSNRHTHIRKPKTWLVDAEVDDPLHITHSTLFCVASTAAVEREECAQLHVTFNPFLQDRATYYKIPSSSGSRQKTTDYFWQGPHYASQGLKAKPLVCMTVALAE